MRIQSLDSFRFIAAFLVVSLHVTWPIASIGPIATDVCRIAVPYFFMVSGYFYKREHSLDTIKKISKYLIISIIAYFLVEVFLYRSLYFIDDEINLFSNYRFWVCNSVPFCPVAWYLLSYIYILLLAYFLKTSCILYILGVISFLFALITGVYSSILGLDNIDSLLWNCSFLSTFCWFALGMFIKQKYNTSGGGSLSIFVLLVIFGLACSMFEHFVLKKVTQMPVNGTTFIGTLPAILGVFILLLKTNTWSLFNERINLRKLSLFVFLSHVAIHYILVSLFFPAKYDLDYEPIIHLSISSFYYINNIVVFLLSCILYIMFSNRNCYKTMRKKHLLLIISSFTLFYSCDKDNPVVEPHGFGTNITSFEIITESGEHYYPFMVDDSTIHVIVPNETSLSQTKLIISHDGVDMRFGDNQIVMGIIQTDLDDFTTPKRLKVISRNKEEKEYKIKIYDLPVMVINTPNGTAINSKEVRIEGTSIKIVEDDGSIIDLGTGGIRGRGNSTWLEEKKPYNIKLDKKHEILGMPKSKHWILLANAKYDRTQIHNATAFEMARLTDYPWIPQGRFVELLLNGEHRGLYYLCEKVRVEKGKIDINEMTQEDVEGENLTGGYLLESVMSFEPTGDFFTTDYFNKTGILHGEKFVYTLGWEIKSPDEEILPIQYDYIVKALNDMESLIADDASLYNGKYRLFFDIETAINWWLVEEAAINVEAQRSKNIYLYKSRGGQFRLGPPWDLDAWTFGVREQPGQFLCNETSLYYGKLFKDPYFVNRVKEKWNQIMPVWKNSIPKYIDNYCKILARSAKRNEQMWPDWYSGNHYPDKTYEEICSDMKESFLKQIDWMDTSIKNM